MPASGPDSKRNSTASESQNHHKNEFKQESERATRARTRLIVEGFSNLALIATFFAGVQAQLISVSNSNSDASPGPVAIATNAAFFGGLIFSVFTAVLATLSARWFSILRDDDADYLSSRWLCLDSKRSEAGLLQNYLEYQINQMEKIKGKGQGLGASKESNPQPTEKSPSFSPSVFDATSIIHLLREERGDPPHDPEQALPITNDLDDSTSRERLLSYILLSPLIASLPSFALFTTGILLLSWDTQPLAVAIFTSITVLICVAPLCGFFVRHRHKQVIRHIYLGRPSL